MNFRVLTLMVASMLGAATALAAEIPKGVATTEAAPAPKADIVATVCVACHMADGNSVITANPRLAGQHQAYLAKQLNNFKDGTRQNPVMVGMAGMLTPEDVVTISTFFSTQKAKVGITKENGPGSLGEKIYKGGIAALGVPACASCHGPSGAGIPAQFPRLGGQHTEYVIIQMKAFRDGSRANAPMMKMIASKLSDQHIAAVADYVQGLH